MCVARVTEISSISPDSVEAAIQNGIARANTTVCSEKGCWIEGQNVMIENGELKRFKVDMEITFELED